MNPADPAPSSERPLAAAILDDGATDVDALLAQVAAARRRAGCRVLGLVMTHPQGREGCAAPMVLVDLDTGEPYLVSQALGQGAAGCRADVQGFARASQVLRRALEPPAALVISNRFGALEAEGGGFAAELLELMSRRIPLLTAVRPRHLAAWEHFTGGAAVLPAEAAAIERWIAAALDAGAPA